jgi:hypothetical protein
MPTINRLLGMRGVYLYRGKPEIIVIFPSQIGSNSHRLENRLCDIARIRVKFRLMDYFAAEPFDDKSCRLRLDVHDGYSHSRLQDHVDAT